MTPPTVFTNTFSLGHYLDEGVRVFLLSANDPLSLDAILAGDYGELSDPTYVFTHNAPFYVGLYTGYNPWLSDGTYTGIYTDPMFGWAQLVNNRGVIEMLDSALAFNVQGIYAGSLTLIPEPSAFALAALGASILGVRWRKARTQPGRRVFANQIEIESGKLSCPSVPTLSAGPVKAGNWRRKQLTLARRKPDCAGGRTR